MIEFCHYILNPLYQSVSFDWRILTMGSAVTERCLQTAAVWLIRLCVLFFFKLSCWTVVALCRSVFPVALWPQTLSMCFIVGERAEAKGDTVNESPHQRSQHNEHTWAQPCSHSAPTASSCPNRHTQHSDTDSGRFSICHLFPPQHSK